MGDFKQEAVERFKGVHMELNIPVNFKRVWAGHRFTDEECQKLLNGEIIEFSATSKKGAAFNAIGKLAEQEWQGHSYWGFQLDTTIIPSSWCDHTFTDDERSILESGQRCHITDCVSKGGKSFDVDVTWEETEFGLKIVPHFND